MPVKHSDYDKVLDRIRKQYGDEVIRKASETPEVERIPTGSLLMDWVTGGGFPLGRWCHFYGGYMSSKTLTAWHAIREAQKLGLNAVYYNIENQFDKEWAGERGVDLDRLEVVDRTTIEDVGEIMESLLGTHNVHVIDSIGAAAPADELAGELRDWNMGLAARTWGKALRRANARFDNTQNMVILINHAKDVFGRMGGEEPAGPKLINYYSSLNLHFTRSSWLFYDKNGNLSQEGNKTNSLSEKVEPDGMEFSVRVPKSRVSQPLRVGRFRMDFKTGEFDHDWVLAKAADFFGLVEKSGTWYTYKDKKFQGENGLRKEIQENSELKKAIIDKVMEDI
jgi:recombination protein RecA